MREFSLEKFENSLIKEDKFSSHKIPLSHIASTSLYCKHKSLPLFLS